MRSNALRKTQEETFIQPSTSKMSAELAWEMKRRQIAKECEEACAGSNSPDLGEFEEKYRNIGVTDFA
jgi:hypothetical protein